MLDSIDRSAFEIDAKLTAEADHRLYGGFGFLASEVFCARCRLEPFQHGRHRIVIGNFSNQTVAKA